MTLILTNGREVSHFPGRCGAPTADFINGTLYAVGGLDASHTPVATNEAYDPKTDSWTEKAPMPTARHHHTSAVVDGKLYVIGGRLLEIVSNRISDEALSNFNDNEMYNPLNDSWTVLEQMPTKRSGIAGLFLLLIVTSMYLEVRTLTVLSAILKNIIQK